MVSGSDKMVLSCKGISKSFGFFFALKNISFNLNSNSILGVLGANGAGKTTLIKILSGILRPNKGEISINGMPFDTNSGEIRKKLGIITDQSFLYDELTIYENLKFYENLFNIFDKDEIKKNIERYTKLFNIYDWVDEPIRNLSTGMKRKVELIRAIIHNPQILMLDELFTGLDFKSTNILLDLIEELKEKNKISLVITTHNISLASKLCDELIVLKRGKINKSLKKDEFEEFNIESYY